MKNSTLYTPMLRIQLLIVLLSLYACGGSTEEPSPAKKDVLTQTWRLIKLTANNTSPYNDLSLYTFQFKADNTYLINSPDPALAKTGTWEFNSNQTKVILNGGSGEFLIISLTPQQMVLEYTGKNYKTGNVVWLFEFTKV